jgi:predicted nucleic acid-binding protein
MSLYMDSCCFIDVTKYDLGHKGIIDHLAEKEDHIKACIQMLDAAEKGNLRVLTGNITISECQHLSGFVDDEVKRLFHKILTSGRVVRIVADSIFIAERARSLMWDHAIRLGGADAHHIATALEANCTEFITSDNGILKWAAEIEKLRLKVIKADESKQLAALLARPQPQTGSSASVSGQGGLFDETDKPES